MNFMIYSSDEYYVGAKTMLTSVFENNKEEEHTVYFLYTDLKEKFCEDIVSYCWNKYHVQVNLFKLNSELTKDFPHIERFSISAYAKLFVFQLLPSNLDRILCLEADAVMLKPVKEFYYQDFEGKCFAACRDIMNKEDEIAHKKLLGIPEHEIYVNLGNALIDLVVYREKVKTEDCFMWIREHQSIMKYAAQDVVNTIYRDLIKVCDYTKYNMQVRNREKYTKNEIESIRHNTAILHYICNIKPWDFRFDSKLLRFYRYYENMHTSYIYKTNYFIKNSLAMIKHRLEEILY